MADIADLAIRARTQGVKRSEKEIQGLRGASSKATTAVRALGAGIAALGAGAAIRAIRNNIRQTASISELGDVAGVSAERIQELSKAFSDMAGITESVTQGALRRFNRRLGLAEDGTGAAGDTFNQLGISIKNAQGEMRATQPVLDAAIERLASIDNESRRAARASELFGEDAGPQMAAALAQGSDALREQIRELHEQGRVLSNETVQGAREANDELNRMSDILSTEFARRIAANSESIMAVAEGLMTIAEVGLDAADGIQTFGEALGFMAGRIVNGEIIDTIPEMESRLSDLREELARVQSEPGAKAGLPIFEKQIEELNSEIDMWSSRLEMARNRVNQMNGPIEVASLNARTLGEEMELLGNSFPEFQQAAMDVRTLGQEFENLSGTLDESLFRIASDGVEQIRDQVTPGRAELRQFREQVELLNLAVDQNIISTSQAADLQRQLNDGLSNAAAEAMTTTAVMKDLEKQIDKTFGESTEKISENSEQWKRDLQDVSRTAQKDFDQLGVDIAESFDGISKDTKSAIGATGQILGDLKDIAKAGGKETFEEYKALATAEALVAHSLATVKALAAAPPPLNYVLAATTAAKGMLEVERIQNMEYQGRKTGGQVRAGESYVVGEEGPEVVTMNGGGHVTPNHQLQGGNSNNVTQVFQLSDNARREAKQQIMESAPMIRNMAKQAVIEAAQNGGTMSRAVGRRS